MFHEQQRLVREQEPVFTSDKGVGCGIEKLFF
jgi:hypothetical protein